MGLILKDINGNLLTRPITHPATDAQVRAQLEALVSDGTITSVGTEDAASSEALAAIDTRVSALEDQLTVLYEEDDDDEDMIEQLAEAVLAKINADEEEY